jgi:phage shock protein B
MDPFGPFFPFFAMTVGLVGALIFVIALPWMILHYIVQWRKAGSLKVDDERMLEDVWRAARAMERRIEALEAILESQASGWRRPQEG